MPLGLGIIGAGIMGERMLRAALEHAADLVRISGVWDADPAALARVGALGVPLAPSAEAVIAGADCVYVATPPATHLAYGRAALDAGRAVFLEKPLAVDLAEARDFLRHAGAARVAVNFPMSSSLAVERLRTWLAEGAVGTPSRFGIEVAFATWPRSWQHGASSWLDGPAEGGFTREVVSHFLFLSRRLLGPLSLQSSTLRRGAGSERAVEAKLEAGGLPGTLTGGVGTTAEDDHNLWTLAGAGAVRLRNWSVAERQRPDGSWVPDADAMPNERQRPLVLRRQLEQLVGMAGGAPHHLATVAEAFEVQEIVEAILSGPAGP